MGICMEVLEEYLVSSTYYSDTNVELAEISMELLRQDPPEQIVIAITGDIQVSNVNMVSKVINMLCRAFESTDNFRFVTGELDGVERIVRAHAKRNNIEVDVYPVNARNDWDVYEHTQRQDRDIRMLTNCHIAVVFTEGRSKECNFFYKYAVNEGKFTTRRLIKPKKIGGSNETRTP